MSVIDDFVANYIGLVEVKRELELASYGNAQYHLMKLPGWKRVSGYYFLDRDVFAEVKLFINKQEQHNPDFNFQQFLFSQEFNLFVSQLTEAMEPEQEVA